MTDILFRLNYDGYFFKAWAACRALDVYQPSRNKRRGRTCPSYRGVIKFFPFTKIDDILYLLNYDGYIFKEEVYRQVMIANTAVKEACSKTASAQRFWKSEISSWFLKKHVEDHVWFNKKLLRVHMTMRVAALQNPDVGVPSKYIEWLCTTSRKFFVVSNTPKIFRKCFFGRR